MTDGHVRSPRGIKTRDLGFTVIELETPYLAFPYGVRPGLSEKIAVAEAVQLIGGFSNVDLMTKASPNFRRFLEPDGHFHGAYGSRVRQQVAQACTKIRRDQATRQAVLTLWDPTLDNIPDMKDYPCTVMLQFEVEGDLLCMNVVMRSNDVWLGLPYDLFQFTQLQCTVARSLDIQPGRYRHTVLSLHLYEEDVTATYNLDHSPRPMRSFTGIGRVGEPYFDIMKRARRLTTAAVNDEENISESNYRRVLASILGRPVGGDGAGDREEVAL